MTAISTVAVPNTAHYLGKRSNWAGKEAGVVLVFCITFVVAAGLIGLFVSRAINRRRMKRQASHV
jgi:ATP/ADP translocase